MDVQPRPGEILLAHCQLPLVAVEHQVADDIASRHLGPEDSSRYRRLQVLARRNGLLYSRLMLDFLFEQFGATGLTSRDLVRTAEGKPLVPDGRFGSSLYLNASSSGAHLIWAFSADGPVGCDVETIADAIPDVGARVYAGFEERYVSEATGNARAGRFFDVWTLKEAVVKAEGEGLGIPMTSFTVMPDRPGLELANVRVLDDAVGPRSSDWQLLSGSDTEGFRISVAARSSEVLTLKRLTLALVRADHRGGVLGEFSLD